MSLPTKCEYLIIGGGIHGLSTAWHLCKKLSSKGQLKEDSVVVIEKTKVGYGATSVACGDGSICSSCLSQYIKLDK